MRMKLLILVVDEIDDNVEEKDIFNHLLWLGLQQLQLQLQWNFNGGVRLITITNRGNGYTSRPRVAISSAPSGGVTAVGIATLNWWIGRL
jgi:hypothetical protein